MQKNSVLVISWILFTALLSLIWFFRIGLTFSLGFAAIGSLVGFLLPIFLDVLLPKMMDGSASVDTTFAKSVIQEGAQQIKVGNLQSQQAPKTPLRSYPLLAAYIIATIFVITSTQNWFGRGFVMGLGFSLVLDLFFYRNSMPALRDRWFSVFRTNLSDIELGYFVWGMVGVFGILTVLAALA